MKTLTCEQLRARFPNMPESTVQRNAVDGTQAIPAAPLPLPHYFPAPAEKTPQIKPGGTQRVRQHSGPQMNKTETAFLAHLRASSPPEAKIRFNAIRFELANNLHLKPDFTVDALTIYEAKGPWASRDAFPRLKMAARLYPEFTWHLATGKRDRRSGVWRWDIQHILP